MANHPHDDMVTTRKLAAAFGVRPLQITRWRRDGLPVAVEGGRGRETLFRLRDCTAWFLERELKARGVGDIAALNPLQQRALLDAKRCEEIELRLAIKRGQYVLAKDAELLWSRLIVEARNALLGVPSRLKQRRPNLDHADLAAVDSLIRESLERLVDADAVEEVPA